MGCSFSRPSRRDADSNPRIFKVFNVDDQGQELSAGKIEITESDLVLHQKSKEPIRWPLRSVRRYGFDAELFSFESGRRCPTGPGIYAFKCRRAEALFNLLQECIQRAGQEDNQQQQQQGGQQQRPAVVDVTNAATSSRPGSLVEIHTPNGSIPVFGGSNAGSISGADLAGAHSPHHYVNGYVASSSPPQAQGLAVGSSLPGPSPSTHGLSIAPSSSSPSVAVASGGVVAGGSGSALTLSSSAVMATQKTHEYVNTEIAVGAVGPSSSILTSGRGSQQSVDVASIQLKMNNAHRPSVSDSPHVVNYAELDLPKSVEELNLGSGASGVVCGPQIFSIVELDPSSSQATYINVPASTVDSPGIDAPPVKRMLALSSAAINGASASASGVTGSAGAVRKVFMRQPSKEDPHNYANLDILSSSSAVRGGAGEGVRGRKLTYIQVDVRSSKENLYAGSNPPASPISLSPSIPESPRRTESYAQIDFHKTEALSKVANSEDEGSRKTRHNSNIEELN